MTKVVNRHREKFDVYIGRGTPFGNPYEITPIRTRDEVIELYKIWFYEKIKNESFRLRVLELKDKILGCSCSPLKCHGDIIKEWLDNN